MTTSVTMTQTARLNNEQVNILRSVSTVSGSLCGEYPELRLTGELVSILAQIICF